MMASRESVSQAAYTARVDALIEAAIQNGATSFVALLHGLPAIYPIELLASLDRLAARAVIDPTVASMVRRQAAASEGVVVEGRSLLPLPRPLDYEWRFKADSARALLNRAADMTPADGDVLLFGTPGLAIEALAWPIGRRVAFLAQDNSVTRRVLALNNAIGSPLSIAYCNCGLPRESADAVLLDPPWYLDFVRPMLAVAAHACRVGGAILITLPPDGTRPTAEADRQAAIAFGRRIGLALIEHHPLQIEYETPFFERNALAAAGIYLPLHWRRGDLVAFRKERAPTRPPSPTLANRRAWTEVAIGRMRLFIRTQGKRRSSQNGLISLIEGHILPTVSRRDPRRRLADVWTSGNRIFRTGNPGLVLEAAILCSGEAISSGVQPHLWGTIREREAVERVATELRCLAALEACEEGNAPAGVSGRGTPWMSSSTNYWSNSSAIISGWAISPTRPGR
jgi:hypothetical protein